MMTENSDLEKRLRDLESRHDKTRAWLIDLVSIVVTLSAVMLFNSTRWATQSSLVWTLEGVVAYFVIRRVTRWALER